ncbi:hypothetical protein KIH13_07175 [Pseudomonas viridiflava]|nr:hypothetical protein KIH13_07175 [Pseudomonas viridiflava]
MPSTGAKADRQNPAPKNGVELQKIQIPTNVPVQRNVLRYTALKACLQGEPDAWM